MVDRSQLRQFMIESFSDDELADLIFDYFPNVRASLGEGMTLGQKVRTLIDFADRHDRLDHLVIVVEKLRPEAYCNFFQTDIDLPPEPETAARDPNKIFISYANPDADFAARLAADLRQRGFDIWMAPDSILPGEKWVAAIERGLRESGIFLLVLSPAGIDSKWVSQETQVAIMLENEGQMRIYPLRVQRAEVPLLLSTRQHIAFDTDYDRGLVGLLAALRPGSQPPAPEAPAAPRPPGVEAPVTAELPLPVLIIDWPDAPNQELTLNKPTITVGRAPENDVVLDLPIVSSRHLRLDVDDTGAVPRVWLTDLGSRNGTFLSGRRLPPQTRQLLEPGDVVNLGDRAGRAISLILHPGYGANAPLPVPAARPAKTATDIVAPDVPGALTGSRLPESLARVPLWAYATVGLLLVALLAFLVLRGGQRPTGNATPATAVLIAAAETATLTAAATEAAPTVAPTATTAATADEPQTVADAVTATTTGTDATVEAPTVEATATTAPTLAPTATDEPPPTAEPTAAAAEPPTATPVALPTEAANFTISRSTPLSFEALGDWLRDDRNSRSAGEIAISADQAHSGSYSLRLAYDFPGSGDDYVMFRAPRAFRIANDRERRFLKLWVLGDGAALNLSAIIEDSEGELWKVYLGEVSGSEWQQLDGYIGDTTWPAGIYGNRGNGVVDYPVRLRGLHLDDVTSSFVGAGAIHIDDVTVE